jgi:hypothetical protein
MPPATSNTQVPRGTNRTVHGDRDGDSGELRRYHRTCEEVDRLLDQGRLFEAIRLNDEARALFRGLFSAGQLG